MSDKEDDLERKVNESSLYNAVAERQRGGQLNEKFNAHYAPIEREGWEKWRTDMVNLVAENSSRMAFLEKTVDELTKLCKSLMTSYDKAWRKGE